MLVLSVVGQATGAKAENGCDRFDLWVKSTPVPNPYARALRTAAEAPVQLAGADVVVVGDSLVNRWPQGSVSQAFPGNIVALYGVESDQIQNVLWRLPQIKADQPDPARVILWIGANDLAGEDKPCAIWFGFQLLISEVRSLWPDALIVVIGLLPRGDVGEFKGEARAWIASHLRSAQFPLGFWFIDPTEELRCYSPEVLSGAFSLLLRERKAQCRFFVDGLHLTQVGYDVIARNLRHRLTN